MKNSIIITLSIIFLASCSGNENAKPNSKGESPEVKQSEPIVLKKKDPIPQTITLQEVSRIALVEADQFITNAKVSGLEFSSIMPTLNSAKKAYANKDYKNAQKLAVEVRQHIEELMKNK